MTDTKAHASDLAKQALATGEHAIKRGETQTQDTIGATADVTEDVLASVEAGQRAAIEAVRGFVDTVDQTLPFHGEDASKRQQIIDSGLEMADKLVQSQYGFLRSVVHTAGGSVRRSDDAPEDTSGN
jgi:hypothetical protein